MAVKTANVNLRMRLDIKQAEEDNSFDVDEMLPI